MAAVSNQGSPASDQGVASFHPARFMPVKINSAIDMSPVSEDSDEAEDEEMVEMPKRAFPAKPGMPLFGALHQKTEAFRDFAEEITNLLKIQHAEVMQRFDQHDLSLKDLKDCSQNPLFRRPSIKPKKEKAVRMQLPEGMELHKKPTFTPKLFSSLTQADMKLKAGAADVDAETAKAKKDALSQRTKSIHSERGRLWRIVHSPFFDLFFAMAILVNTVFIGVEVQISVDSSQQESLVIQVVRNVFTGLFTLELFLRMWAAGLCGFFCLEEWRWNMLDLFIVLSSWWETAVELLYASSDEGGGGVGLTGLRTLRIVRITRLVKLARVARILRFVMALRTLTQSIIYTLKSLIWALVLMTLIVYVFGILFVQAVDDHRKDPMSAMSQEEKDAADNYFGNLWLSMLSLFMSITGGVSWEQLLVPLHAVSPFWVFVFLFYVSFTIFAVLNVVTGVFCQSAIDSAQSDHDAVLQSILANKQAHIEKIRYLFNEIDAEDVGVITYQMFQDKVTTKEVQTYFESIDLDIWDAWSFFKLLDLDSGGAIEIEEFLMGCLRLRGSARAMDMAKLCHDQAWLIRNQSRFWSFVEEELTRTRSRLDQLTAQVHGV